MKQMDLYVAQYPAIRFGRFGLPEAYGAFETPTEHRLAKRGPVYGGAHVLREWQQLLWAELVSVETDGGGVELEGSRTITRIIGQTPGMIAHVELEFRQQRGLVIRLAGDVDGNQ